MGKRSPDFEKKPRDAYFTIDPAAVNALKPHLWSMHNYVEPCAGAGDLIRQIDSVGGPYCVGAYDIEPQAPLIFKKNCLDITERDLHEVDLFITNPPYTWKVLQPILEHLRSFRPTWMLLPADYMHNVRMGEYMQRCTDVVSVGRMYWEENKIKGVDNYCWYKFTSYSCATVFHGR